jgi:hypothetical protein
MADALPYESLYLVADLVESPPAADPYNVLKERLMMSRQLTSSEGHKVAGAAGPW